MFRRFAARAARYFPARSTRERLLPWITLFVAIVGGTAAIYQYADSKKAERIGRVVDIHALYLTKDIRLEFERMIDRTRDSSSKAIAKHRCDFIRTLQLKEEIAKDPVVVCNGKDMSYKRFALTGTQRDDVRKASNGIVGNNLNGDQEARSRVVFTGDFYFGLVTCVEQGACDRETSFAYFLGDMVYFINMTCPLYNIISDDNRENATDVNLAHFIIKYQKHLSLVRVHPDKDRSYLFFCDANQKVENQTFFERLTRYWLPW